MSLWHFAILDKDPDFGDDDSSGIAQQPENYPNVARPGGGYPEGRNITKDEDPVPCPSCGDAMDGGSCNRCDWGPQNRAVPVQNFPLDPFRDDKAGIRAGSWKFGARIEEEDAYNAGPDDWYVYTEPRSKETLYAIIWPVANSSSKAVLGKEEFLKYVKQAFPSIYEDVKNYLYGEQLQLFTDTNQWNFDQ